LKRLGPFFLPILSGLAGFASFPRIALGHLAWIALVPLALFIARSGTLRRAFLGGFLCGAGQFFPLLVWIPGVLVRYGGVPAPLGWLMYTALVAGLACCPGGAALVTVLSRPALGRVSLLAFPFAWVSMELVRNYAVLGGFPWLQIGYSQSDYMPIVQLADLTGVYRVSFLTVWVNASLALVLAEGRGPGAFAPLGIGAALVVSSVAYGRAALARWDRVEPRFTAALFQGNIAPDDPEPLAAWKFGRGYVEMADALGASRIDLAVLPESPVSSSFESDPSYRSAVERLAARFSLGLIFNNTAAGPGERWFNSAYFLTGRGEPAGRYDKVHLVPFGEYVPLRRLFFFAESITRDVGDFTPGASVHTVALDGHRVGALVCFEAIFPELARELVRDGGELLVNLTNDGWYGPSAAPYQHLAMARWRAVENRRYLLRAANSGVSAVIAPTGRIERSTNLFAREVCLGRFAFLSGRTPYASRGDAAAIVCAIIALGVSAAGAWKRRGPKRL